MTAIYFDLSEQFLSNGHRFKYYGIVRTVMEVGYEMAKDTQVRFVIFSPAHGAFFEVTPRLDDASPTGVMDPGLPPAATPIRLRQSFPTPNRLRDAVFPLVRALARRINLRRWKHVPPGAARPVDLSGQILIALGRSKIMTDYLNDLARNGTDVRMVPLLHDMIPLHAFAHREQRMFTSNFMHDNARVIAHSDLVLTNSAFTRDEVVHFAGKGLFPELPPVVAVPLSHEFRPTCETLNMLIPDAPYVMCVGTLTGRKNLECVMAALMYLHRQGRAVPDLVLAGSRRKRAEEYVAQAWFAPLRDKVRQAWSALAAARKAAKQAAAEREAIAAEEEYLRHAVAELDKLDPQAGEEEQLDARRRLMQSAEKIRSDVVNAYEMMGQGGAETQLGDALRWLDGVAHKADGALEAPMAALSRAMVELDEAMEGVVAAIDTMSFNPIELEETEERLFAIRAMARKHEVLADDLAGFAETLRGKLDALDAGEAAQAGLEKAVRDAQAAYDAAADALTDARRKKAGKLDKAVAAELAPLKMERAVFATQITEETPGPEGRDAVSFTVATNPGAPAGPLGKIASGGELSRFLLALKVCLAKGQTGLTMIFDEIDRGVGGATADAVGRRLAALSQGGQVLVVTHSPQVAALGAHHWRVSKAVSKGMTLSTVTPLSAPERVDEVARMLAGDTITEAARAAARELLGEEFAS